MRIYKTKVLARFARREGISNASLTEAIERAERGLVDADLTGGLIKQRVARRGQGLRGGYRTLVAFRKGDLAVFLFGFAKSDRANIEATELTTLRDAASSWMAADAHVLAMALEEGILFEVKHDDEA